MPRPIDRHRPGLAILTQRVSMALTGLLAATLAHAADTPPPIKPGLWEMSTDSQQLNGKPLPDAGQMAAQLKNLPPEMRQKIEEQMKAQGVQLSPSTAGGGLGVRMCLTQEMLSQNRWQQAEGDCKSQVLSRSGNTWKWAMTCTKPPAQGEGTTVFTDAQNYTGEVRMTSQQGGKPQVMTMKHRARWISADCGGLKPTAPAQR
ncbi:MAG TPA: DUF3617 domain-containing protein [Candidatus Aquabacterium excrementipullorum]|nr:DUF3617 domain-containing protein [Candidatus Aquabacterium excrementipullorum]